jgi:RNA polymerase sigma factor (TIGR02999 family)
MSDVSQILNAIEQGDAQAAEQLLPLVYDELRRLAARKLAQEQPGQTLDATALVHEAYLRLVAGPEGDAAAGQPRWQTRGHFLAAAAEAMRRILIENARRKKRCRHGGGRRRVLLVDVPAAGRDPDDLLALDEALAQFAAEDPEAAQLVKLRFYAGLSVEEAAEALDISRSQAYRNWSYASAWLRSALGQDNPSVS